MTYTSHQKIIPPHGGYRKLMSYQMAEIVFDLTQIFCKSYMSYQSNQTYTRTYDQMVQAARSGKQNIAEGSQVSGTSKKTELKLVSVARASLEELLNDYLDFLRVKNLPIWGKDDARVKQIRALAYSSNKSYKTYLTYMSDPESAANCLICIIHQTNYLLDKQLAALEKDFLQNGGFTEKLYRVRKAHQYDL
ncbi:four helix bundle protein [Candidatus Microgenomates bacterium]|nr:MAG: four helix bundle protein [Candidatus Microgenomates bacterium]